MDGADSKTTADYDRPTGRRDLILWVLLPALLVTTWGTFVSTGAMTRDEATVLIAVVAGCPLGAWLGFNVCRWLFSTFFA